MKPEELMRRAVTLAIEKAREGACGPFGAVIARGGEVVAEGWNQTAAAKDPTAHAEVVAIRRACEKLGAFDLSGCVIYASCEPCPMCLGAIWWARLDRVYYAATSADAERHGFDDAHFYREMSLPADARRVPMIRIPDEEATRAFLEWNARPDKIKY